MVRWNGSLSSKFDVANGVKQGGVLSPLLFFCLFERSIKPSEKSEYWLPYEYSFCWCSYIC